MFTPLSGINWRKLAFIGFNWRKLALTGTNWLKPVKTDKKSLSVGDNFNFLILKDVTDA